MNRVAQAILDFLGQVPETGEPESLEPVEKARRIANAAATRAGMTAATLALPPGPLAWLTIVPELVAVWRIQAQMVADMAAVFGRRSTLSREAMLYCLFRHMAAQATRDLVVRVGERLLVREVSTQTVQRVVQKVGVRVTQRAISKGVSRWVPLVGALGVGTYAWYDTRQVAATSQALFEQETGILKPPQGEEPPEAEGRDGRDSPYPCRHD